MRRWPPVVIIVALLVAIAVIGRDGGRSDSGSDDPDLAGLMAVAPPEDAVDSVWFCAGQTARPGAAADGTIVIANASEADALATITAVADDTEIERTTTQVELAGRTTRRVPVRDLIVADWAAVTVAVDGGAVAVEHEVVGPRGRSVATCHNQASNRWSFPSGATTRDAQLTLAIYNPYPRPATVDLAFTTEESVRRPQSLQGLPIEARSLAIVDVSAEVTERPVIATSLETRQGQVVVDRIQTFDGSGSATSDEEAAVEGYYARDGIVVTPGVPEAGLVWAFPSGLSSALVREQIVVANASEEVAEVELTVVLDEPDRNGELDPFPLDVGPGETATFEVGDVQTIPIGVPHSVIVRSENGVPVVAERHLVTTEEAQYSGVASSTGSPVSAPEWVLPTGAEPDVDSGRVVIYNPGTEPVDVELVAFGDGDSAPIPAITAANVDSEAEPPLAAVVPGGQRVEIRLDDMTAGRTSVLVSASGPVVVDRRLIALASSPVAAPEPDEGESADEPTEDENADEPTEDENADEPTEDENADEPTEDDSTEGSRRGASTSIGIPLPRGLSILR